MLCRLSYASEVVSPAHTSAKWQSLASFAIPLGHVKAAIMKRVRLSSPQTGAKGRRLTLMVTLRGS